MLLAMDIGNTNIKLALCKDEKIFASWRVSVQSRRTADEFGAVFNSLFAAKGYSFSDVDGVIVSSVVPSLNYTIEHLCMFYMGFKPMMVSPALNMNIKLQYDNPAELGADRIANAVAAYNIYGAPAIIVDLGTATTFGYVDGAGVFKGGAIAPGIKSSVDALVASASKLPLIELVKPSSVISTNTISNMQAGAIFGFSGLVEHIVTKMKEQAGEEKIKVIATGGLTELLEPESNRMIDIYDRALTLKGLQLIYKMNRRKEGI